jgi:hypothetical protein
VLLLHNLFCSSNHKERPFFLLSRTFFPSFTEERRFSNFFSKDKQKQVLWKNKVIDMAPLNKSWEKRAIAVAGDTKL